MWCIVMFQKISLLGIKKNKTKKTKIIVAIQTKWFKVSTEFVIVCALYKRGMSCFVKSILLYYSIKEAKPVEISGKAFNLL